MQMQEIRTEHDEQTQTEQPEILDSYTVRYNGQLYRYNDSIVNILLLGTDRREGENPGYGSGSQADVIVLAALDTKNQKMTFITVSRDTMCNMTVLDENGQESGTAYAQLALAHSYGDGGKVSCELCCQAVSEIFYGLPVKTYASMSVEAIAGLTDSVGGVTVQILDDIQYNDSQMYQGAEVNLNGEQARKYLQLRSYDLDGNSMRMQKQQQFMTALMSKVLSSVKSDPTSIMSIYSAVKDEMTTSLTVSQMLYLAQNAAQMDMGGIRNIEGCLSQNGNLAEFYPDETALYEMILDVFYEPADE